MLNIFKHTQFNKDKNILKSQKGAALITVIIFTVVLVSFVIAILTMAGNDTKLSALQRDSTMAFYRAEAGIEETIWKLNKGDIDLEWLKQELKKLGEEGVDIDTCKPDEYRVKIFSNEDSIDSLEELEIKSTGVIKRNNNDEKDIKRTVKVIAQWQGGGSHDEHEEEEEEGGGENPPTPPPPALYEYAVLSNSDMRFSGSKMLYGNLHANGNLRKSGSQSVEGAVSASGTIRTSGSGTGWDNGVEGAKPVVIPQVPFEQLKLMAQNNHYNPGLENTILTSKEYENLVKSGYTFKGVVYVIGNISLTGSTETNIDDGALIVEGNVKFSGSKVFNINRINPNSEWAYPGPIGLAATGNIIITGSSRMNIASGVIQANGKVDISGSYSEIGAVVGDEVIISGSTNINYDKTFMEQFPSEPGEGDGNGNGNGDEGGNGDDNGSGNGPGGPGTGKYVKYLWQETNEHVN